VVLFVVGVTLHFTATGRDSSQVLYSFLLYHSDYIASFTELLSCVTTAKPRDTWLNCQVGRQPIGSLIFCTLFQQDASGSS